MAQSAKRPGAVTAAATLLILFGSLSLLCGLVGAGTMAIFAKNSPDPGEGQKKVDPKDPFGMVVGQFHFVAKETPGYYPVHIGVAVLDLLLGIGQIATGAALLRMSGAARWGGILCTLLKLLLAIAMQGFAFMYEMPAAEKFMKEHVAAAPGMDAGQQMGGIMGYVGAVFMILFQLAIAGSIVVLLNTKTSRDAFAGRTPPPADEPEKPAPKYEGYDDDYNPPPATGIQDRPS